MNYKRLAIVLAFPAYYFLMVLLAHSTGWVLGTTSNAWGNGAGFFCISALVAILCVAGFFLLVALGALLEELWKWLHQKPVKYERKLEHKV
jgi:hypothetical protein